MRCELIWRYIYECVCVYEKALDWDWMARRLDWIARYHHLRSLDFFYMSFVVAAFAFLFCTWTRDWKWRSQDIYNDFKCAYICVTNKLEWNSLDWPVTLWYMHKINNGNLG
jgi:hypothetical protein